MTASAAMMAELAARFDPKVDDSNDPLGASYGTVMQMLTSWRENAWRNAEALVTAPNPAARAAVAAYIESAADTVANTVLLTQSYSPPLTSTAARDAYCAVHKGDASADCLPVRDADAVRRLSGGLDHSTLHRVHGIGSA